MMTRQSNVGFARIDSSPVRPGRFGPRRTDDGFESGISGDVATVTTDGRWRRNGDRGRTWRWNR
ncbi:hypothetical protein AB7C87_15370 [Natrarchaeobius sp. A-rgal3]|uniref:hypothetical protein n=1 Tax=Natrarchaeobius versutus TaxID=1679078 RepID=UPI00350FE20E